MEIRKAQLRFFSTSSALVLLMPNTHITSRLNRHYYDSLYADDFTLLRSIPMITSPIKNNVIQIVIKLILNQPYLTIFY